MSFVTKLSFRVLIRNAREDSPVLGRYELSVAITRLAIWDSSAFDMAISRVGSILKQCFKEAEKPGERGINGT